MVPGTAASASESLQPQMRLSAKNDSGSVLLPQLRAWKQASTIFVSPSKELHELRWVRIFQMDINKLPYKQPVAYSI